mmetsp:Transcript_107035/g.310773  ORF Transcript_107035/g.310773 Transcript_107035/m.310773 type:complete len:218 (+) Transcript_107035:117-770(+)
MVEERATLAPFLHCRHHANTDRLQLTFPHRRTVVCSCPLVSAAREQEPGMTCTQRRPVVIIRRRRRRRARGRRCVFPPAPFSPPPLTDTAVIHRVAATTAATAATVATVVIVTSTPATTVLATNTARTSTSCTAKQPIAAGGASTSFEARRTSQLPALNSHGPPQERTQQTHLATNRATTHSSKTLFMMHPRQLGAREREPTETERPMGAAAAIIII